METPLRHSGRFAATILATVLLAGCEMGSLSLGPSTAERRVDEPRDLRLAAAARASGQYDPAIRIYTDLLKTTAEPSAIYAALGDVHLDKSAFERAAVAYRKAASDAKATALTRVRGHVGLGRTRLALGDPALAEPEFLAALELDPNNPVALNGLGVAADMLDRHDEAEGRYRQALALDPGNARIRSNLGLSYALSARFDDAVAELSPLTVDGDKAPKAKHNLALALGLMGRPDQARLLTVGDIDSNAAATNDAFYGAARLAYAPPAASPAPTPAAKPAGVARSLRAPTSNRAATAPAPPAAPAQSASPTSPRAATGTAPAGFESMMSTAIETSDPEKWLGKRARRAGATRKSDVAVKPSKSALPDPVDATPAPAVKAAQPTAAAPEAPPTEAEAPQAASMEAAAAAAAAAEPLQIAPQKAPAAETPEAASPEAADARPPTATPALVEASARSGNVSEAAPAHVTATATDPTAGRPPTNAPGTVRHNDRGGLEL